MNFSRLFCLEHRSNIADGSIKKPSLPVFVWARLFKRWAVGKPQQEHSKNQAVVFVFQLTCAWGRCFVVCCMQCFHPNFLVIAIWFLRLQLYMIYETTLFIKCCKYLTRYLYTLKTSLHLGLPTGHPFFFIQKKRATFWNCPLEVRFLGVFFPTCLSRKKWPGLISSASFCLLQISRIGWCWMMSWFTEKEWPRFAWASCSWSLWNMASNSRLFFFVYGKPLLKMNVL